MLAAGFAAVVLDGVRHRSDPRLADVVAVTRLPGPALAVPHSEPRCRLYADFRATIHPDLPPTVLMDFVYEP